MNSRSKRSRASVGSLVLDEAQSAADAALEEFRLLSNRLGAADGFRGMVLSGRTSLARRLGGRPWASLESRLSTHVRLGPIDAEDAACLLRLALRDTPSTAEIERLHARSGGNPARLIRLADLADDRPPIAAPSPAPVFREANDGAPAHDSEEPDSRSAGMPNVDRPPLRFEDGMIEVGWDDLVDDEPIDDEIDDGPNPGSSLEARLLRHAEASADAPVVPRHVVAEGTAPIVDPYAALQSRAEWSRAVATSVRPEGPKAGSAVETRPSVAADRAERSPAGTRSQHVRAENGQEFAPYGRLFAQLNAAGDSE